MLSIRRAAAGVRTNVGSGGREGKPSRSFDDELHLLRDRSIEALPNMQSICGVPQAMVRSGRLSRVRFAMAVEANSSAVVHVIDDDASIGAALESLLEEVGLVTRT